MTTRAIGIFLSFAVMLTAPRLATAQATGPAAPPPAGATSAPPSPTVPSASAPRSPGVQMLLSTLAPDMPLDRYVAALRALFSQLDADIDGKLTATDIDLHDAMAASQVRAMSTNGVMRYDLDGDGFVTEDEIRIASRYDARVQLGMATDNRNNGNPLAMLQVIENTVRSIMALDADHDRKVSYVEAMQPRANAPQGQRDNTMSSRVRQALSLVENAGNELTLSNFLAAGEAAFRNVDADNDGKISQQELVDVWRSPAASNNAAQSQALQAMLDRAKQIEKRRQEIAPTDPSRAGCAMPKPSEKAGIVVLGAYETEALSSVAIGSQDVVAHAGRVNVEPGSDPLYVVISTYSALIWQFSGAVERVERVVLTSNSVASSGLDANRPPLVGATGLPADRVSFFAKPGCINYFSDAPSSGSIAVNKIVRDAFGREPAKVAAAYAPLVFSVPSGKVDSVRDDRKRQPLIIEKPAGSLKIEGDASGVILRTGPGNARKDLLLFSPAGVMQIDAKAVVSSQPAQPYEVLPNQAGLAQLLDSGALVQNQSGEYVVQKKMRFPPGLTGSHSVKFVVPHGTPMPDGDPGHSCVAAEDAATKGANCH